MNAEQLKTRSVMTVLIMMKTVIQTAMISTVTAFADLPVLTDQAVCQQAGFVTAGKTVPMLLMKLIVQPVVPTMNSIVSVTAPNVLTAAGFVMVWLIVPMAQMKLIVQPVVMKEQ